jgi:PadR family transcriptional regulator, regulatory protein AphA
MSSPRLTNISYCVLVLVGREGAGAHDLVRMARQGPLYAEFADSQWYAEPKRLAKLGYLEAQRQPGKTRERTHYTLTPAGVEALQEWMREPTGFSRFFLEPAIRLLSADLVGEDQVLASLQALRGQAAAHLARVELGEAVAPTIPHRERYLRLNHALARRLVEAHLDWLDEVERELAARRGRGRH